MQSEPVCEGNPKHEALLALRCALPGDDSTRCRCFQGGKLPLCSCTAALSQYPITSFAVAYHSLVERCMTSLSTNPYHSITSHLTTSSPPLEARLIALTMNFVGKITKSPMATDFVAGQAFRSFDKDKSGFIEAGEVNACLLKVFSMLGQKAPPQSTIDSAFNKVAGEDRKLDKEEFAKLVREVMKLTGTKH